jgi:hypothetical protein
MEYLIGVLLGWVVAGGAVWVGFDRDRAFYPAVLIVVASYYVLFAVMGASGGILIIETVAACAFILLAVLGFKRSPWIIAAGLVGHGVFDFARRGHIHNPGMPSWWPGFCMSIDVFLGVWLAMLLWRRSRNPPNSREPVRHFSK